VEYLVIPHRSSAERGFSDLRWSLVVAVAMQALSIAFVAWFAFLLTRIPLDANPFDPAYLGGFATAIGLVCGSALLGLVAGIMFFAGLLELRAGRGDFGAVHARDVDCATIYFAVAFVTTLVSALSGVLIGHGVGVIIWTPDSTSALIFGGVGVARGLFVGLAFATVLRRLVPQRDRRTSMLSAVLLAATPAAAIALSVLSPMPIAGGDPTATYRGLWTFTAVAPVLAAVDLVAYLLLYRSFTRVCRRMRAGELLPVWLQQVVSRGSCPVPSPPPTPSAPPTKQQNP